MWKKNVQILITALALPYFLTGCFKPDEFPIEPIIENVNISSNNLGSYDCDAPNSCIDTLYVFIDFTDGDGDLGSADPENPETSIFLEEIVQVNGEPVTATNPFSMQADLTPQGNVKGIKGTYIVRLLLSCYQIGESYKPDTLQYTVYIKDQAGNESNRVQTPKIFVDCQP